LVGCTVTAGAPSVKPPTWWHRCLSRAHWALQARLEASGKAWAFFQAQAPSYQRKVVHWVQSAKAEATRLARIEKLIAMFAKGRKA
jgi:hypothetical protein